MYNENTAGTVVIKQVANGYIVIMPVKERDPYANLYGQLPSIIKGAGKDELLESLQGDTANTDVQQESPGFEMTRVGNVFIFKTFKQALEFIGTEVLGKE